MKAPLLKVGDWVIYRKQKFSASPGPRAQQTSPAPRGDTYSYVVEKYWIVQEILDGEMIRLVTRRGKSHEISIHDPRLRKARWWERLFLSNRFQRVEQGLEPTSQTRATQPQ